MQCCPDNTTGFVNQTATDVPYFGTSKPMVTVLYVNNGVWTSAGVFTSIQLQGSPTNNIHVDHGGQMTGLIKLS